MRSFAKRTEGVIFQLHVLQRKANSASQAFTMPYGRCYRVFVFSEITYALIY